MEVTSISSVLLSISLSMFAEADICNCKSSVNELRMIECESIMADTGLICMVKNIGPRKPAEHLMAQEQKLKNY